ncbi:MAG: glycosyltransferase [Patescibacteria group bacterium]
MKISLVMPAYNEEKYIKESLESVSKYGQDIFEIIVINNGSTDQTFEVAQKFPNVRVVNEPQKGLPLARNRGLQEASGDVVAFVDADTRISKKWVSEIKKEFQGNPNLVSLSGPYRYYDATLIQKILTWVYWNFLAYPSYLLTGYLGILGNLAAKKEALQKIGGFDKNIKFYGDDTDITKRLHKIGKVKFSSNFFVYSSARRFKGEGLLKTGYRYGINFLSIVFLNKPWTSTSSEIR